MNLHLDITDLRVGFRPGPSGDPRKPLPTLDAPATGRLQLTIERSEVEHALERFADLQARDWGVDIQNVRLTWTAPAPRMLAVNVSARAAKGFLGATVNVAGQADLTDTLDLRLYDLTCTGEGVAGSLVAPVIAAKLHEHEGRTISLSNKIPPYLRIDEAHLQVVPERLTLHATVTAEDPSASSRP